MPANSIDTVMPDPIVPPPMTAALSRSRGLPAASSGTLPHFTVGKKRMDQRLALRRIHQFDEDFPFPFHALGKGQFRGGDDRFKAHDRETRVAPWPSSSPDREAHTVNNASLPRDGFDLVVLFARAARRQTFLQWHLPGKGQIRLPAGIITVVHRIQYAMFERFRRRHMSPRCYDHLGRGLDSRNPRQSLRAAGSRAKAEIEPPAGPRVPI